MYSYCASEKFQSSNEFEPVGGPSCTGIAPLVVGGVLVIPVHRGPMTLLCAGNIPTMRAPSLLKR
jgi:hypothetical protein